MYKYSIWAADIISDVALDLEDPATKRKLVEAKMQIDRTGTITDLFLIKEGTIRAFPASKKEFNMYIESEGKYSHKDFYEEEFIVENLDSVKRQAKALNNLITEGKVSIFDINKLVDNGLDPEVIKVWQKLYSPFNKG